MSCTATHTVMQADLDAGHYANRPVSMTVRAGRRSSATSKDVPAVQAPTLAITKAATETSFNAVGQVLHYTIVATNVGNTTLAAVTVTDPGVTGLSCTPANGSALAPGASMSCTATHTVTQADLDAGHYANQACVDDGAAGAAQQCATKNVPAVQAPASDDHEGRDGVELRRRRTDDPLHDRGDQHGQHDAGGGDGDRPGRDRAVLHPGQRIGPGAGRIAVVHGHAHGHPGGPGRRSLRQPACVDDGAAGAAQQCATEDVPAVQAPTLAITKAATETSFNAVGQVMHYTIVATNVGNTTLAAVTVTDPGVTGLSCTPANGSALAPGASMSCTATHTVTQADLDAGHYANQACVDDGAAGAAQQCASKDVPAVQGPTLAITKAATETSFNAVGQVLHYTIVATNVGNTTLAAVTVTDPGVTGLSCTPANGSALAPGGTMTCTATHTVTQADLDAGHYANQACVDDGAGGAAQQCASKDVPAVQAPALTITKAATETSFNALGQVLHYTIVARNTGNTTLAAVTVTDPGVTGLSCTRRTDRRWRRAGR